jgi:hypothetical protein
LVLAGPQYRATGTIRLRVTPGGFATIKGPDLRVEGEHLLAGDLRIPLDGATPADLARAAGVDVGAPEGLYHDGSGVTPDQVLRLDAAAAAYLGKCLGMADAALRGLSDGLEPVLWPEHFDVGVTLDEVNFGVSLGDGWLGEPYAYIGPWKPREGEFWNAPFGAARPMRELPDAGAVLAFFRQGRE